MRLGCHTTVTISCTRKELQENYVVKEKIKVALCSASSQHKCPGLPVKTATSRGCEWVKSNLSEG